VPRKIFAAYPQCDAAVKIAAHAYANIGSYDQAKSLCQRVLKSQPLNVDMYYLLAQIAEEQNELDITKEYLRKIIYLDSSFVKAYLDLASIYEREKQIEKTKTMRTSALSLLNKLPADTILDTHTGINCWRNLSSI
jgi:chemotaxis protein methyltransferase CheR